MMSKPAPVAQVPVAVPAANDTASRYFQLMLLVLAAGAIYPILYLRQVYQTTMLDVFHINHSELGYLYSMLGTYSGSSVAVTPLAALSICVLRV